MNNLDYTLMDSPKAVKITLGIFVVIMLWIAYMLIPNSQSINESAVEEAFIQKVENENAQAKKMFGPLLKKDAYVKVLDIEVKECKAQETNQLCTLHTQVQLGKDKKEKRVVEVLVKQDNNGVKLLTSTSTTIKE